MPAVTRPARLPSKAYSARTRLFLYAVIGIFIAGAALIGGMLFIDTEQAVGTPTDSIKPLPYVPPPLPTQDPGAIRLQGTVVALETPIDDIQYVLLDSVKNRIAYLTATDDKLRVVQETIVEVVGTKLGERDGIPLLSVSQIVFK